MADYEVKPSEVPTMEAAFDVLLNDQPPALPFFATYFDFSQVAGQISKDLSEKERQDLEKNKALLEIAGGRVFSFIPADTICPGGFGVASCIRSFVQMMDDGVRV